jgi:uncharacterized protein (DUF58 family)
MVPTRRAIALACCGLPIALLPVVGDPRLAWIWPLYLCLLALAVGTDAIAAPRRAQVALALDMPATVAIGEPALAALTLRVEAARPVPVVVAVDVSGKLAPRPLLRGAATRRGIVFELPLVPTRRGRIAVDRAWVRLAGPLGLVERTLVVPLGREAAVVPQPPPIRANALRLDAVRDWRAGLKIERYQGDGSDFESLKGFATGDDTRAIDWRSSAHQRQLVVRQYRAERNHQIVLAVDTGRLMCEPLAGVPRVDHAVTAALLLAYVSARAGDRVALATFGAGLGLWMEPRGGMTAYREMTQLASRIDYTDVETNFTLGLTGLAQRLHRRSLAVVLTDFVDTVTAELMLDNLGRLAARHVVVFVALQDPRLAAAAAQEPAGLRQLNRAVVAAALLRDRELVMRKLRRMGVIAIDAVPAALHPQLIDAYLEIKRRERI